MSEYRKINLNTLHFSDEIISYDDALKDSAPLCLSKEIVSGQKEIKVTKAEKDYEKKCVKLEISC